MKIFYFSFTRFPSEKAHSLYIAKVAESFANLGKDFVVVVPRRLGSVKKSFSDFYDVKDNFRVVKLPCIDLFYLLPIFRHFTFYLCMLTFSLSALLYAFFKTPRDSIIFANDLIVAMFLTFSGRKIVYELHDYPQDSLWLYRRLFNRVYKIQTNNYQKKTLLENQFGVPENKIYTAHNGVTIEDFDIPESRVEARKILNLDPSKKTVVYTGHLYDWKGVDTLVDTAKSMQDVDFLFIGGSAEDVTEKKCDTKNHNNIHFLGFKPHSEIPMYQRAADVLVVPNTAKIDISKYHTSPMKIFEYMASKTPIVASDIPSIREILNEENSFFFVPDDCESLSNSIDRVINLSDSKKTKIVRNASLLVIEYSWLSRAKKVFEIIKTN